MSTCQCEHCGQQFVPGQNDSAVEQLSCPSCGRPYRSQPSPTVSDMAPRDMPDTGPDAQDDFGGNPLQEGMLGGWKNNQKRDESFASVRKGRVSLFETPEFETTHIVAPPDLYHDGMKAEAAHKATVQLPRGITDNLHAALGNLQAWAQNPYENGQLRPYNKYWKVIRPSYMNPGSLRIGVADPQMAEIINHVAQTDDATPLYEYRGKESHTKTAGPLAALIPAGMDLAGILGGGADAATVAAGDATATGAADATATGVGDAATAAGASEAAGASGAGQAVGTSGIGGLMNKLVKKSPGMAQKLQTLNPLDDLSGAGGGVGTGADPGNTPINDASFYARTGSEDDAFPDSHDEIPKNEDGDHKQQDDGNNHEWQRDISVDPAGGSLHSPSFDPGGPAFQRLLMLLPLVMQYIDSGQDASDDPLIDALHQSLDAEVPGYLGHGDDEAANHLLVMIKGNGGGADTGDQGHTDENAGGKRTASTTVIAHSVEGGDFLPDVEIEFPFRREALLMTDQELNVGDHVDKQGREGVIISKGLATDKWMVEWREGGLTMEFPEDLNKIGPGAAPPQASQFISPVGSTSQGPHTPEQIQVVQQFLLEHGQEMGLEGQELIDTILSVPTNPLDFADILAQIQQSEPPPTPPAPSEDAGMSAGPPAPAQESAPPGATMPMPGMGQQQTMMAAVQRYAADSVADKCPECGSHTTELLNEEGKSHCVACGNSFDTKDKEYNKVISPNSSRKLADEEGLTHNAPHVQGVPIADQESQRDLREEQDSGHTWTDEEGNPLQAGQEYHMYSDKYDIPDLIRVEHIRPDSLVYTLTGEYGLGHSTELSREEANIEGLSFEPIMQEGEEVDSDLEENDDNNTPFEGSPEHSDASAPHGLVASVKEGMGMSAKDFNMLADALAKAPVENRAALAEHIANYLEHSNPLFDRDRFLAAAIGEPMSGRDRYRGPEVSPPADLGVENPDVPASGGGMTFPENWNHQAKSSSKLEWLMEGVPKTAGANYTAMEQRTLIDEPGTARNADRLQLEGTHYLNEHNVDDEMLWGI